MFGVPTKAQTKLGWKPKYDLAALVAEMVAADLVLFAKEKYLKDYGFSVNAESGDKN